MNTAHLYPVPDPEPGDAAAGEQPIPFPAPAPPPAAAVDGQEPDDIGGHDPDASEDQTDKTRDESEDLVDEDLVDASDDQPRRRALSIPDLRPYYDIRPLAHLGPLAVTLGKSSGPRLLRTVGAGARLAAVALALFVLCTGRGLLLLLAVLSRWLSGSIGERGSVAARIAGLLAAGYAVYRLCVSYPLARLVFAVAGQLLLAAAGAGRLPLPGKKKTTPSEHDAAGEKPKRPGRLAARFRRRGDAHDQADTETPSAPAAADTAQPPPETPTETSPEAVAEVSVKTLAAALHDLVGPSRGVLLTALRDHLQLPDTRAVRQVLEDAGIPTREGVRAVGGNGPGVHRDDIPPLPSPPDPALEDGVGAGESANANANANNAANAGGEGSGPGDALWTAAEVARGYRIVQDDERGPSAWRIEHHEGVS